MTIAKPETHSLFGNKKLNVLLLIALLIRLSIYYVSKCWQPDVINDVILESDAKGYHDLALCILDSGNFCRDGFRTPGYPLFISAIYFVFGVKPYCVLFAQIFVNLFSIVLVQKIATRLFDAKAGFVAAVIFAFEPHNLMYIFSLWSETLFVFILLFSFLLLLKAVKGGSKKMMLATGLFFSIAILIRPVLQFYPVAIIFFLLLMFWKTPKAMLARVACFIIGIAMGVLPWLIRNQQEFKRFELSSITGYNLLAFNAAYYETGQKQMTYDQILASYKIELDSMGYHSANPDYFKILVQPLDTSNPFRQSDMFKQLAMTKLQPHLKSYVFEHIKGTLKLQFNLGTKIIYKTLHLPTVIVSDKQRYNEGLAFFLHYFFSDMYWYEIASTIYMVALLCFIYLFSFITISKQWKNKSQRLWVLLLLATGIYFTLISGILANTRYRIPCMPFLIILSSFAGSQILAKMQLWAKKA